jgi:sucrose-6-phosphate hydrolase SacC (GH32 family)
MVPRPDHEDAVRRRLDTNTVTGLKTGNDDPILLIFGENGINIAYSTDGARTFTMYNGGQQVVHTTTESRDPKVQWDPAHNRWTLALVRQGRRRSGRCELTRRPAAASTWTSAT